MPPPRNFVSLLLLGLLGLTRGQTLREPAPDFICPEDEPNGSHPHEEFCDKYYECTSGRAELMTCEDGFAYDNLRRFHISKCDEYPNIQCQDGKKLQDPQPSADGVCPRQNGRYTHPDPTECVKFVVCKQGKYVVKDCSNGLHFDPDGGHCTWPAIAKRSGCEKKKLKAADGWECPAVDEEARDPAKGAIDPNPTYPHPTDCAKFYICINGVEPRPNACAFGLVFDINSGKCVDPALVPECADWYADEQNPKVAAPVVKKVKKIRPPPPPKEISEPQESEEFICPLPDLGEPNPHPTYPHPTDCSKFYVCIEGVTPRINQCTAELVYNIDKKLCDAPANVPDCADWYDF